MAEKVKENPLGKKTTYHSPYDPSLLFPMSRKGKRDEIGVQVKLPFQGIDIWNNYELSWLNLKGKPQVAIAEFRLPCASPLLIESKSLKLYFNSFNQAKFENTQKVIDTIRKDLSESAQCSVEVYLHPLNANQKYQTAEFPGKCIDDLDVEINEYLVNPKLLKCGQEKIQEELYSNLLKSNCLVTDQPDWGSVYINYQGPKIDHASLLKYLISFRQHNEFHEQCVERIFMDLMRECKTEKLTVYGKYTRRGGLDINPFRSNFQQAEAVFVRTPRQ